MSTSTDADELAAVHKILSWGFMVAVTGLAGIGWGLLAAVDAGSPRFDFVVRWGGCWLCWLWMDAQLRSYRPPLPLDAGWFTMLAFTPMALYYLWRYERWRGVGKLSLVLALWAVAYALSVGVRYVFSALLASRVPA